MSEEKSATAVRRLAEYAEDPLSAFECRRTRRTLDVVEEIETDRNFKNQVTTKLRGWFVWIGLGAATWTAVVTLKFPARWLLGWLASIAGP